MRDLAIVAALLVLWAACTSAVLLILGALRESAPPRLGGGLDALGRCAENARKFDPGPGSNRGHGQTSRGVHSSAARRI